MTQPTLWVLEDDMGLLEMMAALGRRLGFRVVAIGNLSRANEVLVEALDSGEEAFPRLVLSDFNLGDGTSEGWLKKVRRRFPNATVICVSGGVDVSAADRLERVGIRCVEKPITLGQLYALLEIK
jgi:DNA-binding NtrC family response regulator